MKKLISPGRLLFLGVLMGALLILYFATLYKYQIVEGNRYYEESTESIVTEETVIAARGNILDRYGRLLISNRNCNNLLIAEDDLFIGGENEDAFANEAILKMCAIITENGDSYIDDLPITKSAPFEYIENMTSLQRTLLEAWLAANSLDSDASAVEVLAKMRTRYGIDSNYTADEMRTVAGVRYEINVRYLINTSDYVFAEDVSIDTITALFEADAPGFEVQVSYIREYNTEYAAHILGYTRLMDSEQYENIYKDKGYKFNATVGQTGVELAFEDVLHGSDGTARVTRTSEGVITSTVYSEAPEPGNHIYLTIDIELQGVAEQALASFITAQNKARVEENAQRVLQGYDELEPITGGALVAVDVNTGEPLCIANYPTYNLESFSDDYDDLLKDTVNTPLLNRALTGRYSPGSTFKPVTALTALSEHLIGAGDTFLCEGKYDKYADTGYAPRCTGIHGALTVTEAITASCNLFFYQVGDLVGSTLIGEYAAQLGLGQKTGIELDEYQGLVASREEKSTYHTGEDAEWHSGDTLQLAIGQSDTMLTPIQIARYCAALANGGTVYNCSILKSISSYDYSESIYEREPEVANVVDSDPFIWELIHTGMDGVANNPAGTAYNYLVGHSPRIAAKTGTTETGSVNPDAVFICYAPANDPQIAIAVVVEKGKRGALLADVAEQVIDYYFNFEQSTQQIENELTLLH